MLNGVNLNYIVVLIVTGGVLLAAVYHTILFLHRRTILLSSYSAYLWATFMYCGFRAIYFFNSDEASSFFNLDEVLQMFAFFLYIRFAAIAFQVKMKEDKYAYLFVTISPYVVVLYLAINTYIVNTLDENTAYTVAKISIRFYLLILGLVMLVAIIGKRKSIFFRYLAAGVTSMIVFGIVSSLINILKAEGFVLGAISWLMFGFFTDVIFFSAAIGFQIKTEHDEKEESLKTLLKKEAEIQQTEIGKFRVR